MGWKEDLQRIGDLLDANQGPDVLEAGSVTPDPNREPLRGSGTNRDKRHVQRQEEGPYRPAAGSREGPEGATAVASDEADEVLGDSRVADEIRKDVAEARDWRPQAGFLLAPPVLWIHYWFKPLEHWTERAFLLIAYPQDGSPVLPRAWAWWGNGMKIGPRHTHWSGQTPGGLPNWGEASICAFEKRADWAIGDPLVDLLDLYSVWVARHLHLQVFGRWPGAQFLHTEYERLTEHEPGELCGCGSTAQTYEDCHLGSDLAVSTGKIIARFRQKLVRKKLANPILPIPADAVDSTTRMVPGAVLRVRNDMWGVTQESPARARRLRFVVDADPKAKWQ